MNNYSQILLRFSALFALIGTFLGAHMAGAGSLAFRPIHAHILVVGWLSLFAWAVYYKIFFKEKNVLAAIQLFTAIFGTIGLTVGMWFHYFNPFNISTVFALLFYIAGGSVLLLSYVVFLILTFLHK